MEVPQQNNLSLGPGHPFECRLENVAKKKKNQTWRFKILLLLCHQFFNSYDLHVFLCFPPEYCFCFWFNMTVGDRGSFVCHNHFLPEFLFFLFLFYLTLQYCIGFAIYQNESATGIHVLPILNPPPSPYHPSGSSQCISTKHPVS